MGTHPIFESDFDCLTETRKNEQGPQLAPWPGQRVSLAVPGRDFPSGTTSPLAPPGSTVSSGTFSLRSSTLQRSATSTASPSSTVSERGVMHVGEEAVGHV